MFEPSVRIICDRCGYACKTPLTKTSGGFELATADAATALNGWRFDIESGAAYCEPCVEGFFRQDFAVPNEHYDLFAADIVGVYVGEGGEDDE